jgi:hypothetical protein
MLVGPTFFSPPIGDHPEGDGLTRLQTAFAGGSSADISSYAIGSGTLFGDTTVSDGLLTARLVPSVSTQLNYVHPDIGRLDSTALTIEYFFRGVEVTVNPASSVQRLMSMVHVDSMFPSSGSDAAHYMGANGLVSSKNEIVGAAQNWYTWATNTDLYDPSVFHHVAYVWDASAAGSLSVYFDGVRVAQRDNGGHRSISYPNTTIALGGYSGTHSVTVEFKGVRVRRAMMYSGASFTPPAGPEAWGPP